MEDEMKNFGKVWLSVVLSLCYCYAIGKIVPKGKIRLLAILPVICLFLILPLNLSTMHLAGITGFLIAWLANFKLLLFSFGKGPLTSDPLITLPRFIALASLPIKTVEAKPMKGHKSPLNYTVRIFLLALLIRLYDYSDYLHSVIMSIVFFIHMYFTLDIVLGLVASLPKTLLGMELEPQFNEPYLATSIQDFWGRRWNLMVPSILRPTVYDPVVRLSTRVIGREWAPLPAVLATFAVSAVMHEIIFYYLGHVKPTFEITCFFMLHGVTLMAEVILKKALKDRWRMPRVVSTPLTIAYVLFTSLWLFLPPLMRLNTLSRAFDEYAATYAFARDLVQALAWKPLNTKGI